MVKEKVCCRYMGEHSQKHRHGHVGTGGEVEREGTRCNSQGGQRYKRGGQPIKRIATAVRKRSSLFRGCQNTVLKKGGGIKEYVHFKRLKRRKKGVWPQK